MSSRRHVRSLCLAVLVLAASTAPSSGKPMPVRPAGATYDDLLAAVEVPGFAGAWLDGGALVVSLVRPSDAAARTAQSELAFLLDRPDLRTKPVVTQPARYSFRELKDWYDGVLGTVFGLPGTVSSDIDERANVLRFGSATPGALGALLPDLGLPRDAVAVVAAEAAVPQLRDRARPLKGGVQITNAQTICTLGFPATTALGLQGFVTNSHCTRVRSQLDGTPFFQPSTAAGNEVAVEAADPPVFAGGDCPLIGGSGVQLPLVCRWSDTAFARLLDSANYEQGFVAAPALGSFDWDGAATYRITAEAAAVVGDDIAKVGRTTGLTLGDVTHSCVNLSIHPLSQLEDQIRNELRRLMYLCQNIGNLDVQPGDSGSPVFTLSGTDATLVGIVWGKFTSGNAFSPIGNVQRESELGPLAVCASGFTC